MKLYRATTDDLPLVLDVLDEAAGWLRSQGVQGWPARFRPEVVMPALEAGETFLARVGDDVVATVTVDLEDPAWSDVPGSALYVHRLARRRSFEGGGGPILATLGRQAASQGRALRLDCVAGNSRLCRYYEDLGFQARGEVTVGGAPGERLTSASRTTTVRRYEKVASALV